MDETADDQPLRLLTEATRLVLEGDRAAGERVLQPLSGQTIAEQPLVLLDALPAEAYQPATGQLTRAPRLAIQARVFGRDQYTCAYCGRRTIFLQILNLLSSTFPDQLPRHPNWRKSETHRLYWDLTTSIDHVRPVSRGGGVDAAANLATVCARCQYQKSNRSLQSLGWTPRVPQRPWDGLTDSYERLWRAVGKPNGTHTRWIAALRDL